MPLIKIADTFELSHTGSVSRIIHDAKVLIAQEKFMSTLNKIDPFFCLNQSVPLFSWG